MPASFRALRIASTFIEIVVRPGSVPNLVAPMPAIMALPLRFAPISVPREIGFAFFAKGLRAFLRVLGLAQQPTDQLFDAQSRVNVGVARADRELLRGLHRERRVGGDARGIFA